MSHKQVQAVGQQVHVMSMTNWLSASTEMPWDFFYAFTAQNVRRCCEPGVVAITRAPVRFLLVCAVQRALDACLLWIHGKHWRLCIIIASLPLARSVLHSCSDVLFGFFMVLLYVLWGSPLGLFSFIVFVVSKVRIIFTHPTTLVCVRDRLSIQMSQYRPFSFSWFPQKCMCLSVAEHHLKFDKWCLIQPLLPRYVLLRKPLCFMKKQIVLDETNWLSLFPYEQNKDWSGTKCLKPDQPLSPDPLRGPAPYIYIYIYIYII